MMAGAPNIALEARSVSAVPTELSCGDKWIGTVYLREYQPFTQHDVIQLTRNVDCSAKNFLVTGRGLSAAA